MAINRAVAMGFTDGTGICMPSAAKKRVMKKSRMYLIFPLNLGN